MKDTLYQMRPERYMQGLQHLIDYINGIVCPTHAMTMIEIGSYAGESTELFAKNFKTVIAIDPYLDDYDPNDITCAHAPLSVVLDVFQKRMINFNNIGLIKATSDDAIEHDLIVNKEVDFIYIDGLHTYDQIKKDITNYLPLIKEGGFIAGHDFHPVYQGIIDGVLELLGEPDATFQDTSWIKRV